MIISIHEFYQFRCILDDYLVDLNNSSEFIYIEKIKDEIENCKYLLINNYNLLGLEFKKTIIPDKTNYQVLLMMMRRVILFEREMILDVELNFQENYIMMFNTFKMIYLHMKNYQSIRKIQQRWKQKYYKKHLEIITPLVQEKWLIKDISNYLF